MAEEDSVVKASTEANVTSEYVAGVKERAVLKEEIVQLTKELNKYKCQAYDFTLKLEQIEKENKKKVQKKKPAKRKVPRSSKKTKEEDTSHADNVKTFENTDTLYESIAEKFPDMPLSQVLYAEKRFVQADTNGNGTIDKEELEKILDNSELLFTKQQVLDILHEIDTDGTNSLDFFECLTVLDLLRSHRRTDLPQSIQQHKSSLCSIQ